MYLIGIQLYILIDHSNFYFKKYFRKICASMMSSESRDRNLLHTFAADEKHLSQSTLVGEIVINKSYAACR